MGLEATDVSAEEHVEEPCKWYCESVSSGGKSGHCRTRPGMVEGHIARRTHGLNHVAEIERAHRRLGQEGRKGELGHGRHETHPPPRAVELLEKRKTPPATAEDNEVPLGQLVLLRRRHGRQPPCE